MSNPAVKSSPKCHECHAYAKHSKDICNDPKCPYAVKVVAVMQRKLPIAEGGSGL